MHSLSSRKRITAVAYYQFICCYFLLFMNKIRAMSTLKEVANRIPKELQNYIGGKYVPTINSGAAVHSVPNPATGGVLTKYKISTIDDVNAAMESAAAGQAAWAAMPCKTKARLLLNAADICRKRNDELAEYEAIDTGRPIAETNCVDIVCAVEALEFMASICATTANVGQHITMNGSQPGSSFGYTRREPLGVTAGIGAWNYPLQSAIWKSAPSLACGNSMVFKPADNTPLLALKLAEIFTEASATIRREFHQRGNFWMIFSQCTSWLSFNRVFSFRWYLSSVHQYLHHSLYTTSNNRPVFQMVCSTSSLAMDPRRVLPCPITRTWPRFPSPGRYQPVSKCTKLRRPI